ncbi:polysaccharide deacetylase family protein [Streptomyces antnestii]|uniref:polysaccharide deacetylase family protein n=1 Tax=Streptomyces antnestii TaxID=2494256 RepID=UPI00167A2480|nr:polysaccharide deacetylase family protein [Streptomyces sp. San01]
MKSDQISQGRRALVRGAALLGLAAVAGCTDKAGAPGRAASPSVPAAAGPGAARAMRPSTYRLRPMAGYGAPHEAPGRLPVRREPILRMDTRDKIIVLSFDDGPDPAYTPGILRTLREYDVRAMFFVCGEQAEWNKDLLREMADDGHVIGNHTWTHPLLTKMSRSAVRYEIERTCEIIDDTTGEPPAWFRAPYGAWNRNVFRVGAELGMEPLAWTVDTNDWMEPGTRSIIRAVRDGAAPGVVVLSHDAGGNRSQSVAALRTYLPELLDSGYRVAVPRRREV